jgi:hypothetical protein
MMFGHRTERAQVIVWGNNHMAIDALKGNIERASM